MLLKIFQHDFKTKKNIKLTYFQDDEELGDLDDYDDEDLDDIMDEIKDEL